MAIITGNWSPALSPSPPEAGYAPNKTRPAVQDTVSDPDSLLYTHVIVSQLGWRIIYKVSYMLWLNSEVKLAGPEFGPDASGSDLDHRHGVFRPMSDATLHAQFCSDRDEPLSAC